MAPQGRGIAAGGGHQPPAVREDATTGPAAGGAGGGKAGRGDEEEDREQAPRPVIRPTVYTEEELREIDRKLQPFTDADRMLLSVFGDTIHHNDGRHLHGSVPIAIDQMWQRRYASVVAGPQRLYYLPRGRVGKRFIKLLTAEWRGARERRWNSEKPLCFPAMMLNKLPGPSKKASEIKRLLSHRMDAWECGRYDALLSAVTGQWKRGDGWRPTLVEEPEIDSLGRRFDAMLTAGKLRAATRTVTDRAGGSLYRPDDLDSKTGRPVLEVLQEKHPKIRIPAAEDFKVYEDGPEDMELSFATRRTLAVPPRRSHRWSRRCRLRGNTQRRAPRRSHGRGGACTC